jgi:hypothetical protein
MVRLRLDFEIKGQERPLVREGPRKKGKKGLSTTSNGLEESCHVSSRRLGRRPGSS